MQEKTSKPVNIQGNGSWSNSYGTFFAFDIVMQNGDVGTYSSKSQQQDKFVIGQEVTYEFHGGEHPKIKPAKPKDKPSYNGGNKYNDPKKQKMIVKQSSLKCAVDLCIANKEKDFNKVLEVADVFVAWVMKEEQPKQEFTQAPTQQPTQAPQQQFTPTTAGGDDLPF